MKKIYILGALLGATALLSSCDDFLNDNREPLSEQVNNTEYWGNTNNVQGQLNTLYNSFNGYGHGSSTNGSFYYSWLSDDQAGRRSFANWTYINVPASSSSWSSPYEEIRHANYIIEGVGASALAESSKNDFIGQARLYRALQYYYLVRAYGDVPLVTKVLDPADTDEVYGARTPRNTVMDYVLEDLNDACANIGAQSGKTVFSRDLAHAIKAEICLFEGSYARYHAKDDTRASKYFKEAADAAEAIAANYPLCDDYTSLYKSFRTAGGGYTGLSTNGEVIFMQPYENGVLMHSLLDYTSASDGVAGITKSAFDAFLFLDGKPKASTTLNNTDKGVMDANGLSIKNLLDVRDKRLSMITYEYAFFQGQTWGTDNTSAMYSTTGYGVSKFNNFTVPQSEVNVANKNYTCAPLYWGARLYMDLLEAKAELGTLTDQDLTKYMAPVWKRAGLPAEKLTVAYLSGINDPANNMGVSSLLWEIRRCRRCELMMDAGIRYWDLIRWHQLDLLTNAKNPDAFLGVNLSMVPNVSADVRVSGDYLDCSWGMTREMHNNREYFYPVPSAQLTLNKNLKQNPGWD